MLEFALPLIQNQEIRKTIETAIKTAKQSARLIEFNEDGSLKLPDGSELANGVLLVFSDKVSLFTEESKLLLPLVFSLLPDTDYKTKMLFTSYVATVDDPSTPFLIGFDSEAGKIQLFNEGAAFPVKGLELFTKETPVTSQTMIQTYFNEYLTASKKRTEAEMVTKSRAKGTFLPANSILLSDYNKLISTSPVFKLAEIGEDVLKGNFSLEEMLQSLDEGDGFTPARLEVSTDPTASTPVNFYNNTGKDAEYDSVLPDVSDISTPMEEEKVPPTPGLDRKGINLTLEKETTFPVKFAEEETVPISVDEILLSPSSAEPAPDEPIDAHQDVLTSEA